MTKPDNQIRIEGDIAFVSLRNGLSAVIDAADIGLIAGYYWCASKGRNTSYAISSVKRNGKWGSISMHKIIMGDGDGKVIDHISGDGLDNRRSNLRFVTHTENLRNSPRRRNNTSGFKGVHYFRGKYQSQIWVNGKNKFLGRFDTAEAAHAAYCEASAKYHGEFGRTA